MVKHDVCLILMKINKPRTNRFWFNCFNFVVDVLIKRLVLILNALQKYLCNSIIRLVRRPLDHIVSVKKILEYSMIFNNCDSCDDMTLTDRCDIAIFFSVPFRSFCEPIKKEVRSSFSAWLLNFFSPFFFQRCCWIGSNLESVPGLDDILF